MMMTMQLIQHAGWPLDWVGAEFLFHAFVATSLPAAPRSVQASRVNENSSRPAGPVAGNYCGTKSTAISSGYRLGAGVVNWSCGVGTTVTSTVLPLGSSIGSTSQ